MSKTQKPDPGAMPDDIAAMTFEQALAVLDRIVQQLESGQVDLEASIEIYTRGTLLKRHCEAKLRDAQERVEKIVLGPDGTVGATPANFD
jgi:exodeoxyribonuclease VII small subunit